MLGCLPHGLGNGPALGECAPRRTAQESWPGSPAGHSERPLPTGRSRKAGSGGLPGVWLLPGLLCDAVMGSLEAWTPPAHSWQVPSGLGVGGGARGSLLSGAPRRLRTPPPGPPSSLPSESEGAARLLGRKARPLSSPCPPCPREVRTREARGPRGPFPSISSEAGAFWGSCRGVRGGGVPAYHDGGGPHPETPTFSWCGARLPLRPWGVSRLRP